MGSFQWHVPWPHRRRGHEEEDEEAAPELNPALLIPGIGGSILNAVTNKSGAKERIWVRLFLADKEFRSKLWSLFDPATGKSVSLDPDSHIEVPDDNFGLYAIDVLDPTMAVSLDLMSYYHSMIVEMRKWGYKDGQTLFGFGYDFRQSNRLPEHMDRLLQKLRDINQQTGRKVDVVTHSMGGLVFRSLVALHPQEVGELVGKWVAIATPWRGAPGFITDTLLTGVEFVRGWESSLFISKWSMHQLLVECPSVYELIADYSFDWKTTPPQLRIVHTAGEEGEVRQDTMCDLPSLLGAMERVLEDNEVVVNGKTVPLPLNADIVTLAAGTRELWNSARLPEGVSFFNIYGVGLDTPYHSQYGSVDAPLKSFSDVLNSDVIFECTDGDGTVPVDSSMAAGFHAVYKVGVPGEHRALLSDPRVHRMLGFFLRVPPHDCLYDPFTDCVLLPSRAEVERQMREVMALAQHRKNAHGEVRGKCGGFGGLMAGGLRGKETRCIVWREEVGGDGAGLVVQDQDEDTVEISFMPTPAVS